MKSLVLRCVSRENTHMPQVRLVHIQHLLNLGVNGETQWKTLILQSSSLIFDLIVMPN